jgi:hypothetical protein
MRWNSSRGLVEGTMAECRERKIELANDNVGTLPAVGGQDTEYYDTVQAGLSLLVGASGYRRYLYRYPFSAGSDRHNLGKINDVSLADARKMIGGWAWTLFQTTRGYDVAEKVWSGIKDVIVEGITDFSYLSAVSDYLREQNDRRTALLVSSQYARKALWEDYEEREVPLPLYDWLRIVNDSRRSRRGLSALTTGSPAPTDGRCQPSKRRLNRRTKKDSTSA